MVGGLSSLGELDSQVLSVYQALFGTIPLRLNVPLFQISYYFIVITLVSAPTSYFTLVVPMREVYCVGYTPRAQDSRSLQVHILDVPCISGALLWIYRTPELLLILLDLICSVIMDIAQYLILKHVTTPLQVTCSLYYT